MKQGLFLLLVLIFNVAFAQVEFTPSKQIVMRGKTCADLEVQAQSILDWTQQVKTDKISMPECFCSSSSCIMDVASISPYFVKELTNYDEGFQGSSAYAGPNCFNAALVSRQTLPHITFTHPLEMTHILNSSLCEEVGAAEDLKIGDILVVRNQAEPNFEVHAGIYLNDRLAFSKYGENSLMPYAYGLDVDKTYGVKTEECRRVHGVPAPGETCYNQPFVNFFRCTAHFTFVSKIIHSPEGLHPAVQSLYGPVSRLDNQFSQVALKGDKVTAEDVKEWESDLADFYGKTGILVKDTSLSEGNREFAGWMHFRLFSLYEQNRRIAVRLGEKSIAIKELPAPGLF